MKNQSPSTKSTKRLAAFALLAAIGFMVGCSSHARVQIVPLDFRNIDPPSPKDHVINTSQCFWWEDDKEHLWIAIDQEKRSPIGRIGDFDFKMAISVKKPPAGKARNYLITQREFRAMIRVGPLENRYMAADGILALYREDENRLRGSFRIKTQRLVASLFGGWSRVPSQLLQGEFVAIEDKQQGKPIAEKTELPNWEHKPPSATH